MLETINGISYIVENGAINIDESTIDIFKNGDHVVKNWSPKESLPSFNSLRQLYFDIETTGLDPQSHQIKLIGMINRLGEILILEGSEIEMLTEFFEILKTRSPQILAPFNGFTFDLDFIYIRSLKLGLDCPIIPNKFVINPTAQVFGKPVEYLEYKFKPGFLENDCAIIDLYHQALSWDFVARKLTKYTLKSIPVEIGLRKADDRIELTYKQMLEIYDSGDLTLLKQYLEDDLKDTKALGDFLIPAIYYQKSFLPHWKLQTLARANSGGKWDDILRQTYLENGFDLSEDLPDDPLRFLGGYTEAAKPGLFLNCCKVDVASLYPSIMLKYSVTSHKDSEGYLLDILSYMRTARLEAKKKAKTGDKDADQFQGALKVMINSAYGFLGARDKTFNDFLAAALVTAYGRVIVKYMKKVIQDHGGNVIEVDTDGLIYNPAKDSLLNTKEIYEKLCEAMPEGIEVEYEWSDKAVFIPPSGDGEGLKKNYLIFSTQNQKVTSVKRAGKFRKRDLCVLEKDFQVDLITTYLERGKIHAKAFYLDIVKQLREHKYPVEKLRINRKARKNEKDVFARNLVDSDGKASYYFVDEILQMKTKIKHVHTKSNTGEYSSSFYVDMVKTLYVELKDHLI